MKEAHKYAYVHNSSKFFTQPFDSVGKNIKFNFSIYKKALVLNAVTFALKLVNRKITKAYDGSSWTEVNNKISIVGKVYLFTWKTEEHFRIGYRRLHSDMLFLEKIK
jgi:hypothetical protein